MRPNFLRRAPHDLPEVSARETRRHDKESGSAHLSGFRAACGCALAVINLLLLAGQELEPIELIRLLASESANQSLHTVAAVGEPKLINEILVDRSGVSPGQDLRLDPFAMSTSQAERAYTGIFGATEGGFNAPPCGGRSGDIWPVLNSEPVTTSS